VSGLLAIIGSAAVLLGFATAVLGIVNQRRAARTAGDVQRISIQVDGRLSALMERQEQLLEALHASGIPVPPPAERTAPPA
jgi:hypothetical protein